MNQFYVLGVELDDYSREGEKCTFRGVNINQIRRKSAPVRLWWRCLNRWRIEGFKTFLAEIIWGYMSRYIMLLNATCLLFTASNNKTRIAFVSDISIEFTGRKQQPRASVSILLLFTSYFGCSFCELTRRCTHQHALDSPADFRCVFGTFKGRFGGLSRSSGSMVCVG